MKSSVMASNAQQLLRPLVNRNHQLNEKAYQRALLRRGRLESAKENTLYSILVFEPSLHISYQQLAHEKVARKQVLDMQLQINEVSVECPEEVFS